VIYNTVNNTVLSIQRIDDYCDYHTLTGYSNCRNETLMEGVELITCCCGGPSQCNCK
jgi:hypothetical protein